MGVAVLADISAMMRRLIAILPAACLPGTGRDSGGGEDRGQYWRLLKRGDLRLCDPEANDDVFLQEGTMRIIAAVFAAVIAAACSAAYAQETVKGQVIKADETTGTLSLKRDGGAAAGPGGTEDYKVRDGLVFNAVAPGDKVRATIESVGGKKTITKLEKE